MADINANDPRPVRPPLARHIDFFDTDGDGIVWPSDTIYGLRRLGFSWPAAIICGWCGHLGFGPKSVPHPQLSDITGIWSLITFLPLLLWSYVPDPFLRVYCSGLIKSKHPCSTGGFNKEGWFDEEAFEKIWAYSGSPEKDKLTQSEALAMIKSYRHGSLTSDGTGRIKGPFEWSLIFWVINPPDGYITKAQVRSCFAGTIFDEIAKLREEEKKRGGRRAGGW